MYNPNYGLNILYRIKTNIEIKNSEKNNTY